MNTSVHAELIEFVEQRIAFHRFLGVKVLDARPGFAKVCLPFREEFKGNEVRGVVHGGVTAVLVDICGAVALWTHFGRIANVHIRVYAASMPDTLVAEGRAVYYVKREGMPS